MCFFFLKFWKSSFFGSFHSRYIFYDENFKKFLLSKNEKCDWYDINDFSQFQPFLIAARLLMLITSPQLAQHFIAVLWVQKEVANKSLEHSTSLRLVLFHEIVFVADSAKNIFLSLSSSQFHVDVFMWSQFVSSLTSLRISDRTTKLSFHVMIYFSISWNLFLATRVNCSSAYY